MVVKLMRVVLTHIHSLLHVCNSLQDYEHLLHDLSDLQREDREHRQHVVAKIPVSTSSLSCRTSLFVKHRFRIKHRSVSSIAFVSVIDFVSNIAFVLMVAFVSNIALNTCILIANTRDNQRLRYYLSMDIFCKIFTGIES